MKINSEASCNFSPVIATQFCLDELELTIREDFERHLRKCKRCAEHVARQRTLSSLLTHLPLYQLPERAVSTQTLLKLRPWSISVVAASIAAGFAFATMWMSQDRVNLVKEAMAADAVFVSPNGFVKNGTDRELAARTRRAWLGFGACGPAVVTVDSGVYLCVLDRAGPLGRVGFHAGDILVELDHKRVDRGEQVYEHLALLEIGDTVHVRVLENDRSRDARVILTVRQLSDRYPFDMEWSGKLTESLEQKTQSGIDSAEIFSPISSPGNTGVMVRRTLAESEWKQLRHMLSVFAFPFGHGGLDAGDVIETIDNQVVADQASFWKAYAEVGRRPIRLVVKRRDRKTTFELSPDATIRP